MTIITYCSLPGAACALPTADCPPTFNAIFVSFGLIPLSAALYVTTHRHGASIRNFEEYRWEQNVLLASLLALEVTALLNVALYEPMLGLCLLPIITGDVLLVAFVSGYMLLHHMMADPFPRSYFVLRLILPEDDSERLQYDSSEQTDDGAESAWGSQDTTVYGDETEYELTDYHGDTEPLLRDWLIEQWLLTDNPRQRDDGDDDDESTFSTASTLNDDFIIHWVGSSESGYNSDSSDDDDGGYNSSLASVDSGYGSD